MSKRLAEMKSLSWREVAFKGAAPNGDQSCDGLIDFYENTTVLGCGDKEIGYYPDSCGDRALKGQLTPLFQCNT